MELIFKNSALSVKQDDIVRFERKYDLILPNDYKEFLIKHNGGTPSLMFLYKANIDLVIDLFFSLSTEKYNIEKYYKEMVFEDKELPEKVLPIASDAFGNIICISCRNADFGIVYFWDHEEGFDHEEGDPFELRLLSNNLSFLLENLTDELP